ncbi:MAG: hypothetical protein KDH89_02065 [Anaerolineae bacterium]|nr:hypothetical protein [Anaerolineae bacterium]
MTARAAQHTLNQTEVLRIADDARIAAEEAKIGAEAAVEATVVRRRAMVIAIAAIGVTIVALYLLKRELDKRLEADS